MAINNEGFKFWQEKLNGAKLILAPMVEQSELPWRMLSRKYGAQLCYTPMMHASVFAHDKTYRAENFVTTPEDRPLIAQFCTDDPDIFVKAAKIIENECDAIDINLGCPQNIARRGHYGSFLQDEWDLISRIVEKGVKNLKVPVTAKIRVFDDIEKTVEYAKMLESSGVTILTVHGRTREQKGSNTGLASWKHIKAVKDAVKIPVFANGNILCYDDLFECLKQTGCDGIMVAESNLYNPALFANLNPYAWDMGNEYLDFVEKYPCSFACIRGHIFKIFHQIFERFTDIREKVAKLKSINGLREVFNEIKNICLKDLGEISGSTGEIEYFKCQGYIRHVPLDASNRDDLKKQLETTISNDSSSIGIKRQLDALSTSIANNEHLPKDEEEKARKLMKLLERKRRKHERIERKQKHIAKLLVKRTDEANGEIIQSDDLNVKRVKYINCNNCKNPKSENCSFSLCRMCCKNKVFTEEIECKAHGLKFRKKNSSFNSTTNTNDEQSIKIENQINS